MMSSLQVVDSCVSAFDCTSRDLAGNTVLLLSMYELDVGPAGIRPYCMTLASNFKCPGIREYCLSYGLRR
jgi:hypothetical protein